MPSSTSSNFHKPRLIASNITVQELHSPKLSHRFCCFATLALLEIHPAKLTMEPKNEGFASDDFPFQLGDVSGFKFIFPGCTPKIHMRSCFTGHMWFVSNFFRTAAWHGADPRWICEAIFPRRYFPKPRGTHKGWPRKWFCSHNSFFGIRWYHFQGLFFLLLPSLKLTFSHLKIDSWNTSFLFGWAHFQVLCFGEGNWYANLTYKGSYKGARSPSCKNKTVQCRDKHIPFQWILWDSITWFYMHVKIQTPNGGEKWWRIPW